MQSASETRQEGTIVTSLVLLIIRCPGDSNQAANVSTGWYLGNVLRHKPGMTGFTVLFRRFK